ncbi:hypothetical protein BGX34_004761 [Mortierella sp. NVP85]|nr:hypothetical protein BGX34_004761 [Mortierella sp. NVP85]
MDQTASSTIEGLPKATYRTTSVPKRSSNSRPLEVLVDTMARFRLGILINHLMSSSILVQAIPGSHLQSAWRVAAFSHNRYNGDRSSRHATAKPPLSFQIEYSTGDVSGIISEDTIPLGGVHSKKPLLFAESLTSSSLFGHAVFDGVFGLAYREMSSSGKQPPFLAMVDQKVFKKAMFGFYMGHGMDELALGGYDQSMLEPNSVLWSKVIKKGYWRSKWTRLGHTRGDKSVHAIVDTGTTQIIMPMDLARAKLLPGARHIHDGIYSLPCKGENLPTLHLQISEEVFEVPPSLKRLPLVNIFGFETALVLVGLL